MNINQIAKKLLPPFVSDAIKAIKNAIAYRQYLSKRIPFSRGHYLNNTNLIIGSLKDEKMLDSFRYGELLPPGYGIGFNERCVEYPWLIAQLNEKPEIILDAGSTFNYDFLLSLPKVRLKKIHILTLAPEQKCFWQRGVSYLFHDLRDIPIRDNYYDTISCISTLEHIGCDNRTFTGSDSDYEYRPGDFILATRELCRVLKPEGSLFITVPFGVYSHLGVQQQFDEKMLSSILDVLARFGEVKESFYRYSDNGWNMALKSECVGCHYVEWSVKVWAHGEILNPMPIEPDYAVGARAVACIRMIKKAEI
jgi:hypothetical protein